MIKYQLICDQNHEFEGWFQASAAFDAQAESGLLRCPLCDSDQVNRALMTPNLASPKRRKAIEPLLAEPAPNLANPTCGIFGRKCACRQDMAAPLWTMPGGCLGRPQMSCLLTQVTTDVLSANTTDVLSADTKDVLSADTTDVLSADTFPSESPTCVVCPFCHLKN